MLGAAGAGVSMIAPHWRQTSASGASFAAQSGQVRESVMLVTVYVRALTPSAAGAGGSRL